MKNKALRHWDDGVAEKIFSGPPPVSITPSVADPDPGSGAFLTPGSGIGFFQIPDPKPIL
jgi:hypothetical protein